MLFGVMWVTNSSWHTITFPSIEEYLVPYARFFRRLEGRELAKCYVTGLMMEGERKSVEPMSERVHASERGMQRLLTEVKWDREGAFGEYRRQLLAKTSDPQGVLVVDDTGFPKKGRHSVCVARQYCGAVGKVANCQVGVSLTYVGQEVAWPYTMDLYIPKSWDKLDEPEYVVMRRKTQMPETAWLTPTLCTTHSERVTSLADRSKRAEVAIFNNLVLARKLSRG